MPDMTDEDLDALAQKVTDKMVEHPKHCKFTHDERLEIHQMVRTKKKTVRGILFICGAMILWALHDIYEWLRAHLHLFNWK